MDRQRSTHMKMCINICLPLCGNNTLLRTTHLRSKNNKILKIVNQSLTLLVRILSCKTIREETHPCSRFCVLLLPKSYSQLLSSFLFSRLLALLCLLSHSSGIPLFSISTCSVSSQASSLEPNSFMTMGSGKHDKV